MGRVRVCEFMAAALRADVGLMAFRVWGLGPLNDPELRALKDMKI